MLSRATISDESFSLSSNYSATWVMSRRYFVNRGGCGSSVQLFAGASFLYAGGDSERIGGSPVVSVILAPARRNSDDMRVHPIRIGRLVTRSIVRLAALFHRARGNAISEDSFALIADTAIHCGLSTLVLDNTSSE